MSETDFWQLISSNVKKWPASQWNRIENMCQADAPDVEYIVMARTGWIELKFLPSSAIPKRATSVLRVDHYTDGQRLWHRTRAACGGRVWVFLRAGDEFFLFPGKVAARCLGLTWTLEDCRNMSAGWWEGRVDWKELKVLLTE